MTLLTTVLFAALGLVPEISVGNHPANVFRTGAPTFGVTVSNGFSKTIAKGSLEVVVRDYAGAVVLSNRLAVANVPAHARGAKEFRFTLPRAARDHYTVSATAGTPGFNPFATTAKLSVLGGLVARDTGKFGVNLVYAHDKATETLLGLAGLNAATRRSGAGYATHRGGNCCGNFDWQHSVMAGIVRGKGLLCDIPNACANEHWGIGGQWKGCRIPYEDKVLFGVLAAAATTNCASYRYFALFDGKPEDYGVPTNRIADAKAQTWWPVKQGLAAEPKDGGWAKPAWMAYQFGIWLTDGATDWRYDVRSDGVRCVTFRRGGMRVDVMWLNDACGILPGGTPYLGIGPRPVATRRITLTGAGRSVRVFNSIGCAVPVGVTDGAPAFELTERPVVVRGKEK